MNRSGADVSRNKDGSIRKSTIRKGKDIYNPVAGAEATIVFRNLTDSAENVEVTYCVGDPPLTVPEELDLCVRHMNTDEFSRVVVYKDKNSATEGADGHRVVYELTLKSFEKVIKDPFLVIIRLNIYLVSHHSQSRWRMQMY